MPKVELNNVSSGYNLAAINSNFEKIETALNDSVLFRDDVGLNPNSMSVDLDMNGKRIFNLPAPVLDNEPLRKGDVGDLGGTLTQVEQLAAEAAFSAETAVEASNSAQLALESLGTSVADAAASAALAEGFADAAESSSRLTVGTVTTGSPGSSASASITGTPGTQAISFTIPRGDVGPQGIQGIQGPAGTGDVVGPASSTDNTLPRFDGTTGKLLQGSGVRVSDTDSIGTGRNPNYKIDAYEAGTTTTPAVAATTDVCVVSMQAAAAGSPVRIGAVTSHDVGLVAGNAVRATLTPAGNFTLSAGTLGYGAGAGGTGTVAANAVTINKPSGQINVPAASIAAGAVRTVRLTNSFIAGIDVVAAGFLFGYGTGGSYTLTTQTGTGFVDLHIRNETAGALNEQHYIQFAVIKVSTS
jgi:hypothetical protein